VRHRGILAALWLVAAAAAHAHSPYHLVCPQAKQGGVKVDADIRGWQGKRFVKVDHTRASFGEARSDDDASFRFATLWDAAHLYVAVEVLDNSIVPAPTLAQLYEGDCVEIALDVDNDSEGGYDAGDFQFVICPTGPGSKPRVNLYRNPLLKISDAPFVRVSANITTEGYVIEAAFSWKALGVEPKAGHVVGFAIDVRDLDADGSKKGLTWAPALDPAANPLRWGDLILTKTAADDVKPILDGLAETNARYQRLLTGEGRETDNTVTIDVQWVGIGRLGHGVGWNLQFRDGRFPAWDEGTWAAFLELLAWTRPQWIRYGVNFGQWEPANDDDDPSHMNWEGFAFRSPAMRHHYRVLDFCQQRGIDVLWANWGCGDRATGGGKWLAESVHTPPKPDPAAPDTDDDPFNDAPYDPAELAESLTACIHHLKVVRKYTCVKQVSLWNEPNFSECYNSPSAFYPEAFWGYYNVLGQHLRRLGLRGSVRILGPETSTSSYAALPWLARALRRHSREVDVLAHHDYLGYADYHRIDRGAPISRAAAGYAGLRRSRLRRPIAITELGNMGNGSGEVGGDEAVWAGSLSTCRLIVEGLNQGVTGFLRWEFKPYGASWQNFGALTTITREHQFEPYRPVFFPHALMCRGALKGGTVLRTVVTGGRDENRVPRVTCAAMHLKGVGKCLLLVNDGFEPKTVTLRFGPRVPHRDALRFGHLSYDASLPETFTKHPEVAIQGGSARLTLAPRSVHALSTLAGFAKVEPLPPLPPREEPKYAVRDVRGRKEMVALMRFNADYEWRVWQSTAGHSVFSTEPEQGKPENRVCRIAYDLVGVKPGERDEHVVAHTDLLLDGRPRRVAFRVKGDGKGHTLAVLFLDAKGEVFEREGRTPVTWTGWKRVELAIDTFPDGWKHWSGDGVVDYPLRGFGLTLTSSAPDFISRGLLEIDDVEIVAAVK